MDKQTRPETASAVCPSATGGYLLKEDYDSDCDEPPSLLLQMASAVSPLEDVRFRKKRYSPRKTSPTIKEAEFV